MRKSHYTQIGKEMDWHPLEQGVFGDARKIKIAVVGIGREAGASFIAANLAYHLAKHVDGVTYMEAEDAQIAETLEGRRHACYSLSLDRALGLAGALSLDRALGLRSALGFVDPLSRERPNEPGRGRPTDNKCSNECVRPDEYNCQPTPKWSTECGRMSEHDCDHALGRDRPTERERPRDSDRNSEPVHNRAHASGRIREPGREWSHAFDWNREPGRLPEHDRPSDAFSMRGTRGKFTDYFGLEKEGLPAGSRRNLYANVNWAVRAPLGAPPSATTTIGTAAYDRAASNASILRTVPLRAAPAETSTLETSPTDAPSSTWQTKRSHAHESLSATSSGRPPLGAADGRSPFNALTLGTAQVGSTRLEAEPVDRPPLDASTLRPAAFGVPLRQPRLRPAASEPQQRTRFHTPRPAASEPCMLAAPQGIGRIPGRYMIVDNPRPESLLEADLVICVVDPLPSRIRSGLQQLEALRDNQIRFGKRFSPLLNLPSPVLWVLNKDNPQVGHRELERSLNIKFDFAVPLLSPEIFYKAEYSSVSIFQMLEGAGGPHPSGISDMQHPRTCPLAPKGADADGARPRFHCGTGAGKAGGRGFWQTGRAPAGASAGGSSGQPRSGCAAACSEFDRLAKRVLKLLD